MNWIKAFVAKIHETREPRSRGVLALLLAAMMFSIGAGHLDLPWLYWPLISVYVFLFLLDVTGWGEK